MPSDVQIREALKRSRWQLQPVDASLHRALLEEWIAADPDHRGRVAAAWWLGEDEARQKAKAAGEPVAVLDNLLVVDRQGPLFFLRCSIAMRIDMQFCPGNRARLVDALVSGLPWLAGETKRKGYAQMIYESHAPRLVRFLETIGFRESSTEHVLAL